MSTPCQLEIEPFYQCCCKCVHQRKTNDGKWECYIEEYDHVSPASEEQHCGGCELCIMVRDA